MSSNPNVESLAVTALQHAVNAGTTGEKHETIIDRAEAFFQFLKRSVLGTTTEAKPAPAPKQTAAAPSPAPAPAPTPAAASPAPAPAPAAQTGAVDIEALKKTPKYVEASQAFLALVKAKGRDAGLKLLNDVKAGATQLPHVGAELLDEVIKQAKALLG